MLLEADDFRHFVEQFERVKVFDSGCAGGPRVSGKIAIHFFDCFDRVVGTKPMRPSPAGTYFSNPVLCVITGPPAAR
jgi:hypothetical protein